MLGLAIALLSAGAIGYEILLMRLFAIVQWHHFATMVVSLALLGYGIGGTLLALLRERLLARFTTTFATAAGLFSVTSVLSFALAQRIPFNPLEIIWDGGQLWLLAAIYLVLALPFACVALAIGLALAQQQGRIGALYRADLVGAGLGAGAVMMTLYAVLPAAALTLFASAGLLAAGLCCLASKRRAGWLLLLAGLAAPLIWPPALTAPRPSPYKALSQTLEVPGRRIVARRSNPLGLVTVVESPQVPWRLAPGLSLAQPAPIAEQLAVFSDGVAPTPIARFEGDRHTLAYLDRRTAALPYHLLQQPRVLVLGAGGGAEVLLAGYHGARAIDAVELDGAIAELLTEDFAAYAGNLFAAPGRRLHVAEGRSFVAASQAVYDLIQLAAADSFTAGAAGLLALNASTLYTVEGLQNLLARLAPGGLLGITLRLRLPPRQSLKLVATAIAALQALELDPANRLALIRGWDTATLLVAKKEFGPADLAAVRHFAAAHSFDLAYLPGMQVGEANRFNRLPEPYLHTATIALLGPRRAAFTADYAFDIEPARDDRPYFHDAFRWRALPELSALRAAGAVPLIEWGYIILLATLAQAVVFGVILVVAPLALARPVRRARAGPALVLYFGAIGLAFLFIEIAYMQRLVLLLGHPISAVAVVLAGFLVFAGLGSGFAEALEKRFGGATVTLAVVVIVAVATFELLAWPALFAALAPLPQAIKVIAALGLIAPLALPMGLPLPLGLSRLGRETAALLPWAWAVNGCASVLGAVLALLLAIEFGLTAVVLLALALYAVATRVMLVPPERE